MLVLYLPFFAFGFFLPVTGTLLPQIAREFGWGAFESGLVLTVHFAGFVTFVSAAGLPARRPKTETLLSAALFTAAAANLALSFAAGPVSLCLPTFAAGGCAGVLESMGSARIGRLHPADPEKKLNRSQMWICVGAAILPAVIFALGDRVGWRAVYRGVAVVLAALWAVFARLTRFGLESDGEDLPKEKAGQTPRFAFFRNPRFLAAALALFLYAGTETVAWGFLSVFFEERLGAAAALLMSFFWISLGLGRLGTGLLLNRFAPRGPVIALSAAGAVCVSAAAFAESLPANFLLTFLTGVTFAGLYPLILSAGAAADPSPQAFSALVLCGGFGTVVLPAAVGLADRMAGQTPARLVGAFCLAATALLFVFAVKSEKPESKTAVL